MKNKTILITVISVIAAILAVVILIVFLNKKPATTVTQTPGSTTGTGGVSNGASPDLAVVGSGVVSVIAPKSNPTQPYSTTAPRVEPASQGSSGSTVALQPAGGSSQQTASTGQVAYNYNQSDDDFLNEYYPDAQQVISGGEGPAGNQGQDPSNQVLYTTGPTNPTGPVLSLPSTGVGVDPGTIPTSSNNSNANIQAYLTALASATASFDIVNNSSLVTAPLQNFDVNAAASGEQQGSVILQAIQALVVPSDVVDVQASYIDAYEQYITYAGQLTTFLNSSPTTLSSQEGAIEATVSSLSTVLNTAATNYQNAVAFYSGSSGSGSASIDNPNPVVPGGPIQSDPGTGSGSGGSNGSGDGGTKTVTSVQ